MPPLVDLLATPLASSAVLARSDDFPWPKLIGFGLVLVVWAIGAMASVLQKAKKRPGQTWTGDPVPPTQGSPPRVKVPPLPPLPAAGRPAGKRGVGPPPIAVPSRPTGKKKAASRREPPPPVPPPAMVVRRATGSPRAADIRRRLASGGARVPLGLSDLFDPPPSARP